MDEDVLAGAVRLNEAEPFLIIVEFRTAVPAQIANYRESQEIFPLDRHTVGRHDRGASDRAWLRQEYWCHASVRNLKMFEMLIGRVGENGHINGTCRAFPASPQFAASAGDGFVGTLDARSGTRWKSWGP